MCEFDVVIIFFLTNVFNDSHGKGILIISNCRYVSWRHWRHWRH